MEINPGFDRAGLFDYRFDSNKRRAFFAFRVAAGPRKPIDENEVRKIPLTQDWRPGLKVSAKNFMFGRSVGFQLPDRRLRLHAELAYCDSFNLSSRKR